MKDHIINKKILFDYEVIEEFICGLILTSSEVKSIRNHKFNLSDTYCIIKNRELFSNFHISEPKNLQFANHIENRFKKLLLNKNEIRKIKKYLDIKGLTVVPYKLIENDYGLFKLVIIVGRGKKNYDKRNSIKENDLKKYEKI